MTNSVECVIVVDLGKRYQFVSKNHELTDDLQNAIAFESHDITMSYVTDHNLDLGTYGYSAETIVEDVGRVGLYEPDEPFICYPDEN